MAYLNLHKPINIANGGVSFDLHGSDTRLTILLLLLTGLLTETEWLPSKDPLPQWYG